MILERLGIDPRALRVVWTLALCAALWALREVLFLFALAILLAYLLLPLVEFVDHHVGRRRSRTLALTAVYLLVVAVLVGLGAVVTAFAARQAGLLVSRVQDIFRSEQPVQIPAPEFLKPYLDQITSELGNYVQEHAQEIIKVSSGLVLRLIGALGNVFSLLIVLVLSFFFLKDGRGMTAALVDSLPAAWHGRADAILTDLDALLAQYMRAMVLVAGVTAVVYGIGLSVLGVPYAVLLALIAFPFEFVPALGPLISFMVIMVIAGFGGSKGLLWVAAFIGVVRVFQDYVLQPYLMGSGVQLPPLMLIFGVLAGQALAGIPGALLSIPAMAAVRILVRHLGPARAAPA